MTRSRSFRCSFPVLTVLAAMGLVSALAQTFAHAQTFPSGVVRVVVPASASTPPDILARIIANALSDSEGKAIRVWNGDWVRHGEEEGDGLAQVREAIMWHVAFAPEACRAEPVRGLVLLSLTDGPGSTRIVMGSGSWRWSDLLHARRGG